jgi:hypothetical protein
MARCELNGVTWMRHKYRDGACKRCGVGQVKMIRAAANRREKRKLARVRESAAAKVSALAALGVAQL